jgi:predicted nucleic acid-binding protein
MAETWAYFDTSVLVKRYLREAGSLRARALLRQYRILSSAIAPVEALSALARRRAMGDLTDRDFVAVVARMKADRAHWELLEVRVPVLDEAEELVQQGALRTLDAIHVASALAVRSALGGRVPFVTADARQRDAARTQRLEVVWLER